MYSDGITDGDLAYQAELLQSVSRTFALTIPQLPTGLRDVVENAYLLCRITDTIEDEPALSARQKRAFGKRFIDIVAGRDTVEPFARELGAGLSSATPASEHDLIANTARVVRITRGFERARREALARCVKIMARGMAEFQLRETPAGLADLAHLDATAITSPAWWARCLPNCSAIIPRKSTRIGRNCSGCRCRSARGCR